MAHRIFDITQAMQPNKTGRLNMWRKSKAEQSTDEISYGLVQLVLDVLKTTCDDADPNDDFTLPTNIDATTLNDFIVALTDGKNFNLDRQMACHESLARFIEMCVEHSENTDWMPRMLTDCLCILCTNNATAVLVAKTMVDFYFRVIIKRYDEHQQQQRRTPFWTALERIREQIYRFIVQLPNASQEAIFEILSAFFKRLNAMPAVIAYDEQGIGEILGKFFIVKILAVNLKLLKALLAFDGKHTDDQHGGNLLHVCANQPAVLNGLVSIISDVKSVQTQRLALDLAAKLQWEVEGRLFQDTFYKICLLSDDEIVRENVVELFRVSFQMPGTDEPDARQIIRHAIQLYRQHRVDYTTCAKRLVASFYDEFTNWDAVFGLILDYIGEDYQFVEKIFHLLKFVYEYIKAASTPDELEESENLLREHAQWAINCLTQIDRKTVHVDLVDHLVGAILHADKELKLIKDSDLRKLAKVIIAMAEEVNMERIYVGHMNVMLVVKGLRRKDYISEEALNALIDSCIKERADQQVQLKQHNVHFDGVDTVLYTAMKLHVLTELELISDECAMRQLCIECDGMLMRKSLDFTNNHNFLGHTILTLVRTHIFAYKKAGNRARRPDTSVSSPSKITDRLFEILQRTPGCIDFLIEAVMWALCNLELYFLAVSEKKALNVMTDCILQKVKSVGITPVSANRPVRDINLIQLKHVEYMLAQIHKLLKVKRPLNVRELIVTLHTKFPEYHFAVDTIRYSIEVKPYSMLTDAILDILKQMKKKTEKEKFIEKISHILTSMPNNSHIRAEIQKDGLNVKI